MIENYKHQKEQEKKASPASPKPLVAGIAALGLLGGGAVLATNYINKSSEPSHISVSAESNNKQEEQHLAEDADPEEEESIFLYQVPQIVAASWVREYFTRSAPEDFSWVERSEHLASEELLQDLFTRGFPQVSPLNHAGNMEVIDVELQNERDLGSRFEARAVVTIDTELIGVIKYPLDLTLFAEDSRWRVVWATEDQGIGVHHD